MERSARLWVGFECLAWSPKNGRLIGTAGLSRTSWSLEAHGPVQETNSPFVSTEVPSSARSTRDRRQRCGSIGSLRRLP